tara:strand:- start:247 stop:396 length:150 start_codon:yes stop_codon:yes gene_type:complete
MKKIYSCLALLALLAATLLLGACSTVKTENGVTIEKQRNFRLNPLDYLP